MGLANLPSFPGRTLVLVDTSGSMDKLMSGKSRMTYVECAALFGVALAAKGEGVDLFGFADGYRPFNHTVLPGDSVLRLVRSFCTRIGEDGHTAAWPWE